MAVWLRVTVGLTENIGQKQHKILMSYYRNKNREFGVVFRTKVRKRAVQAPADPGRDGAGGRTSGARRQVRGG